MALGSSLDGTTAIGIGIAAAISCYYGFEWLLRQRGMKEHSFDVGTVLGIGTPDASPLPRAREGEIVLRVAEGFSLVELRDSEVGNKLIHRQDWYEGYDWARLPVIPGTYRLRVPVPGSYGKTVAQQQTLLAADEGPAPVTLVTAALLCLQISGQPDPLRKKWTRCAEPTRGGSRVALAWVFGRVSVYGDWVGYRLGGMGSSSLRT